MQGGKVKDFFQTTAFLNEVRAVVAGQDNLRSNINIL